MKPTQGTSLWPQSCCSSQVVWAWPSSSQQMPGRTELWQYKLYPHILGHNAPHDHPTIRQDQNKFWQNNRNYSSSLTGQNWWQICQIPPCSNKTDPAFPKAKGLAEHMAKQNNYWHSHSPMKMQISLGTTTQDSSNFFQLPSALDYLEEGQKVLFDFSFQGDLNLKWLAQLVHSGNHVSQCGRNQGCMLLRQACTRPKLPQHARALLN